MTGIVESIVALGLLVRSLCVLNKLGWKSHWGVLIAHLMLAYACGAIIIMHCQGVDADLVAFYLFGIPSPRLPYVALLVSMGIFALFERRHEAGLVK